MPFSDLSSFSSGEILVGESRGQIPGADPGIPGNQVQNQSHAQNHHDPGSGFHLHCHPHLVQDQGKTSRNKHQITKVDETSYQMTEQKSRQEKHDFPKAGKNVSQTNGDDDKERIAFLPVEKVEMNGNTKDMIAAEEVLLNGQTKNNNVSEM